MSQFEHDFRKELQELLAKYSATIVAEDHWTGYPECGQDVRMTVEIDPIYKDGECLREYTEIDLGSFVQFGAREVSDEG